MGAALCQDAGEIEPAVNRAVRTQIPCTVGACAWYAKCRASPQGFSRRIPRRQTENSRQTTSVAARIDEPAVFLSSLFRGTCALYDGQIGQLKKIVIDNATWIIRYLVIATWNRSPGKQVLVSTQWVGEVSGSASKVFANLSRESIKTSPEYSEDSLLTRDYRQRLHEHYRARGYGAKLARVSRPDRQIDCSNHGNYGKAKPPTMCRRLSCCGPAAVKRTNLCPVVVNGYG